MSLQSTGLAHTGAHWPVEARFTTSAARRSRGGPLVQLVILDRDGVINIDRGAPITSEHAWRAIPGSLDALARLNGAGYRVVVASNQPGVRQKALDIETLNAIHHRMQHELLEAGGSVDAVFFCTCLPRDGCECRMPNPGMLLEIASRLRISLENVPVIGASLAAVDAARAAGARPIFVRTGAGEDKNIADSRPALEIHANLTAAVDSLLAESAPA
jgi:D-glycero-D-manno-heptose 1,7-bisphosphate phosphatase